MLIDYENTNRLLYETGWRILTVHRRIGTADVWGEEAAWQDSLLQSILTTCGNGPKGTFTKSPISVGRSNKFFMDEADPGGEHEGTINEWRYGWNKACHFKCYSIEASKRILGSYIQARIRRFEQTCPYVGNFLGIFCYKASYAEFEKVGELASLLTSPPFMKSDFDETDIFLVRATSSHERLANSF